MPHFCGIACTYNEKRRPAAEERRRIRMNTLKENPKKWALVLAELVVGLVLLIRPEGFARGIIVLFGLVMLAGGGWALYKNRGGKDPLWYSVSAAAILIGLICTVGSGFVLGIFAAFAIICGIILILIGVYKYHSYQYVKAQGDEPPRIIFISAIAAIVLGIVVILHPFNTMGVLLQFMGFILVAEAVMDGVSLLRAEKRAELPP